MSRSDDQDHTPLLWALIAFILFGWASITFDSCDCRIFDSRGTTRSMQQGEHKMTVSESLRKAVKEAVVQGKTRYRIAKDAGLDHTALTRFLAEGRDVRISTVDRLAEAVGLELRSKSGESKCKE